MVLARRSQRSGRAMVDSGRYPPPAGVVAADRKVYLYAGVPPGDAGRRGSEPAETPGGGQQ